MRKLALPGFALAWLAIAPGAAAVSPVPPTSPVHLDVRRARLDNGLRVVLSVDHTSPTVAVDVMYDVGSRNEERGHSGFAHLFEHMMFQGSANVPRGEHFRLVIGHGGTLNGTTNADRTHYFELMPQSELALVLWLEADRMKSLDVSQKNLDNQRAVVKEEYRMRVENRPYVPAGVRLDELVFQGYYPYEHATIGSMRDLDASQLDWVRSFHDAYYAPNLAVVSIAGDFDPDEAMTLVRRYFGDAKAQPSPRPYQPGDMPPQTAPRDAVVVDAHAKLPAVLYGWPIPPAHDADHYALELARMLFADGETSLLYRALVREQGLAVDVDMDTEGHRGPDAMTLEVKLAASAPTARVEKLVAGIVGDVARLGPSDAQLAKVRARIQHKFLFGLESNFARAATLSQFELFRGDASLVNSELDRYLAVTREDIQRVVAKYLVPEHRSRVEVKPGVEEKK